MAKVKVKKIDYRITDIALDAGTTEVYTVQYNRRYFTDFWHSRTFDTLYDVRTGIKWLIGMLKDKYSLRRVHKHGRRATEAHVDPCILCMYVMTY